MGSIEWLRIYGIDAQKLDFFSVLQSAAFRHCDGVVRVLKPPDDTDETTASTPAVSLALDHNADGCIDYGRFLAESAR
jgi:hypothetical protein